ncbi:uncharacterized protein LOC18010822 [Eutrema salsugineum]|uniref:uncharacterized protein LOC18010822 n=1 Tax=Eutrema salsugineum TaxID=72664 RepID=UPI000CED757C|nr:uncharacterized protein LOC18010822 [Eutrema salsugineum]
MDTEENQDGSDEDLSEESEENSEHSTDDEADSSDVNEDGEDVDDAAYSDGEDYSVYGKVKDEDDDEDEVCIENVRNRYGETGSMPMSWGTAEDGYASLPAYLHSVNKANPGTVSALHVDSNNKFKYLFLAFGSSIASFQYMRRVIVVDGCHLTEKYEDGYPLVIVSDSHLSIKKTCQTVFPWAKRGICFYHLQHNIVTKFRGKQLLYLVKRVAYAYNLYDYNRYMAELRQIKPDLADYLKEADVSLWSRVHFVGDRYNIKTSNVAESINAALKKAWAIPFHSSWISYERSSGVEYLLAIRGHYADAMEVDRIDTWRYYVKGGTRNCIVDLEHGMCEYGVFYIEKIPCSHAIAAALAGGIAVDSLVCPTYSKNYLFAAYSANIYPQISEVQGVNLSICLPPDVRRKPGRRKKSRWQSWLEIARRKSNKPRKLHKLYSCSQCKQPGHTLPNCTSKIHKDNIKKAPK